MLNTIAIKSTKRHEGWILINEDDFRPEVHVLWVPGSKMSPVTEVPTKAQALEGSNIVVTTTLEVPPALDRALGISAAPARDEYSLPKEISFNRRPVGRPKKEKE